MQTLFAAVLCSLLCEVAVAGNTKTTVAQVSGSVTLTEAVDYVITGDEPFAANGSIDIANSDAVVIFTSVKPSVVKSTWLSYISLSGTTATVNNTWVGIYENGAIVYPHTKKTFTPLTVYSETNFEGESKSDFIPYTFYNDTESLDGFEDNVRSFKLKRGYMATFANLNNGQGYSRCFVAQDEDLEVSELQLELAGRVGFIRVFPWNKTTKKGYCGNGTDVNDALNTTWHYGWDAGSYEYDDYEYIPQHHHEGWPSWSGINALTNCNTVLGNNEPDNTSGSEQYIASSDIESTFFAGTSGNDGTWISNAYASGFRVGTPAMASSTVFGWFGTFADCAEEYNCRLDFAAVHGYWYNTAWYFSHMCDVYMRDYDLPVWLTEFNYGANWTSWPGTDTSGSEENQLIQYNALHDILDSLEANANCERYAIYNWVQDCRSVWLYSDEDSAYHLTLAGEYYSELQSTPAYTQDNSLYMSWTYHSPSNFSARYLSASHRVLLSWTHMNGKQTDSIYVERMLDGESSWTVLDRYDMPTKTTFSYSDTITGISGLITYRIHDFDSDSKQRYSEEVYVSVGGTSGNEVIQYGSVALTDPSESVEVEYVYEYADRPAVFVGLQTNNNSDVVAQPYFKSSTISTDAFTYQSMCWAYQEDGSDTFDELEYAPFMVLPADTTFYWGDLQAEVSSVQAKDTFEVTFLTPFPEGVTPIVIGTINNHASSTYATMYKIWDVTNTGFKGTFILEEGSGKSPSVRSKLAYFAITPGQACIDADNDIWISAGLGHSALLYRTIARNNICYIETEDGADTITDIYTGDTLVVDTILMEDPILFAELQTANTPVAAVVRGSGRTAVYRDDDANRYTYTYATRATRIVDTSVQEKSVVDTPVSTADRLGWVAIHGTLSYTPEGYTVGIDEVTSTSYADDPLEVRVKNRIVYVRGVDDFELYTIGGVKVAANATQEPGVYLVCHGKQSARVLIQ